MAFLLTRQVHYTEADKWSAFASLSLRRDFNYITMEKVWECECIKRSDAFYAFRFKDGSVLALYWNSNEKKWDEWLTYVEPWAVSAIEKMQQGAEGHGQDQEV